ncbi:MAG: hypothetical protein Q9180_007532 [Flavoplaca navasiana]
MALLNAALLFASLICLRMSRASPLPQVEPDYSFLAVSEGRDTRTDRLTPSGANCWISLHDECWAELEMDRYVQEWWAGPIGRQCGTQAVPEGFGDCFLRRHEMGVSCSVLSEANCGSEIATRSDLIRFSELAGVPPRTPVTDLEKRQAYYAGTNIVAIKAFFETWNSASDAAFANTASKVADLVTTAAPAPDSPKNAWKNVIIEALLAGLAFLPGINAGAQALNSAARQIKAFEAPGRAILTASSSVYREVFNTDGSAEANLVNIGQLSEQLAGFNTEFKNRLDPALNQAINNITAFRQMANTTIFSIEEPPRVNSATVRLEAALTTYLVSIALSSAGWYGVAAPQTDVDALLKGQLGELNIDYGCPDGVDPVIKQCKGKIWQDVPNNQGFTLVQGHSFLNDPWAQFDGFFGNNGNPHTTPEQLFVGAAKCRQKPNWGSVGVSFENGEMNFDCLSQLKICTYNYGYVQEDYGGVEDEGSNRKYLEEDCSMEEGWGYNSNRYDLGYEYSRSSSVCFVEPGYMGPMRTGSIEQRLKGTSGE